MFYLITYLFNNYFEMEMRRAAEKAAFFFQLYKAYLWDGFSAQCPFGPDSEKHRSLRLKSNRYLCALWNQGQNAEYFALSNLWHKNNTKRSP